MEKIAIISDIHSNITAFKAILEDIEKRGIKRILCAGDLVLKGSSPCEVVDLAKQKCEIIVKGNAEEGAIKGTTMHKIWHRETLGEDRIKYLDSLPMYFDFYMSGSLIRMFHASKNDTHFRVMDFDSIDNKMKLFEDENGIITDIILYGDINHPEIIGTRSFTSEDNIYILQSEEEVDGALQAIEDSGKDVAIVAQTTFSLKKFDELTNIIKSRCNEKGIKVEVDNTICNATERRQKEAEKISQSVEYMVIIGGKNSANTKKLFEIAKRNCRNYIHIETKEELKEIDFSKYDKVGVMAGSSTPKKSINELVDYLKSL